MRRHDVKKREGERRKDMTQDEKRTEDEMN